MSSTGVPGKVQPYMMRVLMQARCTCKKPVRLAMDSNFEPQRPSSRVKRKHFFLDHIGSYYVGLIFKHMIRLMA